VPPACGGVGGEAVAVPIESLTPGDLIYSHDGTLHPVIKVIRRTYSGPMFHIVGENGQALHVTEDLLLLSERRVKHLSPSGHWSGVPRHHFERARRLRQTMSPPEVALWCALRGSQLGVKFRKQHPIGPYIADFYSHECGLVIEVDGSQHFDTEHARTYDRERDLLMERYGLNILRFSAHDVGANLAGVLASIYRHTCQQPLESDPTKQWRLPDRLCRGDGVYLSTKSHPGRIAEISSERLSEEVLIVELDGWLSFVTNVCALRGFGLE
ncbi:MAG: DUF559 domain-containing protein, partial [FCB group bacterium]|nr:DUF559 domain-containing protein [FCB group bacterium]